MTAYTSPPFVTIFSKSINLVALSMWDLTKILDPKRDALGALDAGSLR
ncbi:hypothetical protein [Escherichia coli]